MKGMSWDYKYFLIPASSLPFSTVVIMFPFRAELPTIINKMMNRPYMPYLLFLVLLELWISKYMDLLVELM